MVYCELFYFESRSIEHLLLDILGHYCGKLHSASHNGQLRIPPGAGRQLCRRQTKGFESGDPSAPHGGAYHDAGSESFGDMSNLGKPV